MSDLLRRASCYLDDHWVVKWFVLPILFMASMLFALGFVLTPTAGENAQLVGLFVVFSMAVVAVGLTLDWLLRNAVGWELLESS
ncbi:hypothetical protein [Halorussus pelagicus]|uniref:hypothetical protein n=1 Tax=Halorussus pelagicus TaxID=2505977 RepID=UPI000FFB4624|nr:hypothetical protein [Halorussus pelagicus]